MKGVYRINSVIILKTKLTEEDLRIQGIGSRV